VTWKGGMVGDLATSGVSVTICGASVAASDGSVPASGGSIGVVVLDSG